MQNKTKLQNKNQQVNFILFSQSTEQINKDKDKDKIKILQSQLPRKQPVNAYRDGARS